MHRCTDMESGGEAHCTEKSLVAEGTYDMEIECGCEFYGSLSTAHLLKR